METPVRKEQPNALLWDALNQRPSRRKAIEEIAELRLRWRTAPQSCPQPEGSREG